MNSKLKKMKLASKISLIISIILCVCFSFLIVVSIKSAQTAIEDSTFGELEAISKANGVQIQNIFDTAEATSIDITNFLINTYKNDTSEQSTYNNESQVYKNIKMNAVGEKIEQYMIATTSNTVTNSEDIIGMGMFFEPYAFTPNLESYSVYVNTKDSKANVIPVGNYKEYSKQEYYSEAVSKKHTVFTKPYESHGIALITAATPIIVDNTVKGVITVDINVKNFDKIQSKDASYPSMFSSITTDDGIVVYDSKNAGSVGADTSKFYTNRSDFDEILKLSAKGQPFQYNVASKSGEKSCKFFYPINAGKANWQALTVVTDHDVNSASLHTSILLISISILSLIIILIVTISTLKKMLNPINNVVQAAKDLSHGNLDIAIQSENQDEIGILSNTFNDTAKSLKTMISEISQVLNAIANNDLNVSTSAEYEGDFIQIEESMNNIIAKLNNVIGEINQSADQVSSGSEQISSGAQALSQGATEQASSIEELSATITEIAEHVKENASNSADASVKAANVGNEIEESNRHMQSLITAMTEISDSSNQIGKIIKTIEDIAFQTNILALNAAVEAARAGSAGKGFAVVADEVRNLASKSAEAAKSTTSLIESSIKAVDNGTKIADTAAKSLNTVVSGVKDVSDIVDKISQASNEQANSINQVTLGVEQISNVIQTNSATAEESAAASEELSGQSQMLKTMVNQFKLKSTEICMDENDTAEIPEASAEYSDNNFTSDKY